MKFIIWGIDSASDFTSNIPILWLANYQSFVAPKNRWTAGTIYYRTEDVIVKFKLI